MLTTLALRWITVDKRQLAKTLRAWGLCRYVDDDEVFPQLVISFQDNLHLHELATCVTLAS